MLGFDTMPEIRTNEYHEFVKSLSKNCPVICLAVLAHGILDQPWVAQTLLMGTVGLQAFNTAGYGPATLQYHLPARCHDDGPPIEETMQRA